MANTIYGVFYPGGGSGKFIQSMLVYILNNDIVDMNFDDGHSHIYFANYLKNCKYLQGLVGSGGLEKYKILSNINDNQSVTLVDTPNRNLDYGIIVEHNLNYKYCYIDFNNNDVIQLSYNHYYKQPAVQQEFLNLANKLFGNVASLNELSLDQVYELVSFPEIIGSYDGYKSTLAQNLSTFPAHAQNLLYRIEFSDIVKRPHLVKNALADLTQSKLSTHAHRQYDRYVQRQIDFCKEKGIKIG